MRKCLEEMGWVVAATPVEEKEPWTIEIIKYYHIRIQEENLNWAREGRHCGEYLLDFIEPDHYIFGAINNLLDSFYGFVEDHIEQLSQEE